MSAEHIQDLATRSLARVAVTGSISWNDAGPIHDALDAASRMARAAGGSFRVLTGMADGADRIAREWAEGTPGVELHVEPLLGAGPAAVRAANERLLALQPELVLAFKEGLDPACREGPDPAGTEHMCRIAAEAGAPVLLNGARWLSEGADVGSAGSGDSGPSFEVGGARLRRVTGDITALHVDVIVNAANSSLLGGGGVDGAIHRAAGPALLEECRAVRARQGGCDAGDAVLTGAGELAARHVVHTVGPVWDPADPGRCDALLTRCYTRSLGLAAEAGARSIAFPCISTGVYRYPLARAAEVVVGAVVTWLERSEAEVADVLLVCFDGANARAVDRAMIRRLAGGTR